MLLQLLQQANTHNMKKSIVLFTALLTLSQIAFISCEKEDDEPTTSLYGIWVRDHSETLRIKFTFNSDLTGSLTDINPRTNNAYDPPSEFTYTHTDDVIILDSGNTMRYRLTGETLSLEEEPGSGDFREFTKL